MLVWAVGSLEGYTKRAELLCASVDCITGEVNPVSVDQAQKWMQALSSIQGEKQSLDIDAATLVTQVEQDLLTQFKDITETFNSRNSLLSDKAKQAVTSHTKGKISWLERQLSRDDITDNIRNLYRGWRRRLEAETRSKMEEIEQKSQVRSSLEVIGAVLIYPPTSSA